MTEHYVENAKAFAGQQAPWRRGVAWWMVLIQGLLLLALGLYILFRQSAAGIQAVQLLGIFLLVLSLLAAIRGVRGRVAPRALPYHMLAAGIGLATGTIISLNTWQEFMTPTASLVIISIGFMLYGLAGLLEWFMGGTEQRTWLALGLSLVSVLLSLAILWSRLALAGPALWSTGIVATVVGLGLCGYAVLLYRSGRERPAEQGGQETAASIDATPDTTAGAPVDATPPTEPLPPTSFVVEPPPEQATDDRQA